MFAADGTGMRFFEASALGETDVVELQEVVRQRVLGLFERRAILDPEAVANMREWVHGGFSLDATIRIEAWDRAGLERLLRYCARPPFASERLGREKRSGRVVYELARAAPRILGCV